MTTTLTSAIIDKLADHIQKIICDQDEAEFEGGIFILNGMSIPKTKTLIEKISKRIDLEEMVVSNASIKLENKVFTNYLIVSERQPTFAPYLEVFEIDASKFEATDSSDPYYDSDQENLKKQKEFDLQYARFLDRLNEHRVFPKQELLDRMLRSLTFFPKPLDGMKYKDLYKKAFGDSAIRWKDLSKEEKEYFKQAFCKS